jgi:hypothetical protein
MADRPVIADDGAATPAGVYDRAVPQVHSGADPNWAASPRRTQADQIVAVGAIQVFAILEGRPDRA